MDITFFFADPKIRPTEKSHSNTIDTESTTTINKMTRPHRIDTSLSRRGQRDNRSRSPRHNIGTASPSPERGNTDSLTPDLGITLAQLRRQQQPSSEPPSSSSASEPPPTTASDPDVTLNNIRRPVSMDIDTPSPDSSQSLFEIPMTSIPTLKTPFGHNKSILKIIRDQAQTAVKLKFSKEKKIAIIESYSELRRLNKFPDHLKITVQSRCGDFKAEELQTKLLNVLFDHELEYFESSKNEIQTRIDLCLTTAVNDCHELGNIIFPVPLQNPYTQSERGGTTVIIFNNYMRIIQQQFDIKQLKDKKAAAVKAEKFRLAKEKKEAEMAAKSAKILAIPASASTETKVDALIRKATTSTSGNAQGSSKKSPKNPKAQKGRQTTSSTSKKKGKGSTNTNKKGKGSQQKGRKG